MVQTFNIVVVTVLLCVVVGLASLPVATIAIIFGIERPFLCLLLWLSIFSLEGVIL